MDMKIEKLVLPETGFIRLDNVLKFIPVGKTTWWRGVKAGYFPQPVKLTSRTTAWKAEDIRMFIEEKGKKSTTKTHNI